MNFNTWHPTVLKHSFPARRAVADRPLPRLVLALLFLLFGLSPALGAPPGGPGKQAPPAVSVTTITEAEVNPPVEFVGRVEAVQTVDIQARVQGYLDNVAFEEGSFVQKGNLLYKIEPDTYQAQVDVDKAKVAKAEATLKKAEQYLRRVKSVKTGGVSASDRETAESDMLQARAQLQETKAVLAQSRLNLGYTTITAPISGRIGKTTTTRGNLISTASGALATIVQMDPIRVVFSISERNIPDARKAQQESSMEEMKSSRVITLRMPNDKLYPLSGRVEFIDNRVDTATGTIAVRALFDNPEGMLLPGEYVTVLVSASNPVRMPVVPQAAVLEDRDGKYVFVVDGQNQVQQRRIKTGPTVDTAWAVEQGLIAGETIVISGIQKVRPGQKVTPVPADKQ
ncbi:MAG TPA: efflux RND transporter periplasmic adaptor subunit [Desulfomicrobiaceae bacterium]|nr:efflux RND transporter periplasmic adaptor subunit [Desulfomicrobiaceae bacterium]